MVTYQGRTSKGNPPATIKGYEAMIDKHARPFFGRMRLVEIEPADVRAYAQHLAAKGLAGNTIRLALLVKPILVMAVEDGLVRSNPALGVRFAAEKHEHDRPASERALTTEQAERLIAKTPEQHQLLVEFLLQTGLRIGETVGLRWSDADLGALRVHVRRSRYRGMMNLLKAGTADGAFRSRRQWRSASGRLAGAEDTTSPCLSAGGRTAGDGGNVYNPEFRPWRRRPASRG